MSTNGQAEATPLLQDTEAGSNTQSNTQSNYYDLNARVAQSGGYTFGAGGNFLSLIFILISLAVIIAGTAFVMAFMAACFAFGGFLQLLVGHAILRGLHYDGYDLPLEGSMRLGAWGASIGGFVFALIPSCGLRMSGTLGWIKMTVVPFISSAAYGAVAGALGSRLLTKWGEGAGILDQHHAAIAGAVGGVAVGLAGIALGVLIILALGHYFPDALKAQNTEGDTTERN